MKNLIFILFFVPLISSAQTNITFDTLQKYSYWVMIYGQGGKTIGTGTGFFLRKLDGALFFFTCAHVAYHKNAIGFLIKTVAGATVAEVDVTKTPNPGFMDVAYFEIPKPWHKEIYAIESEKRLDWIRTQKTAVWGFPGHKNGNYTLIQFSKRIGEECNDSLLRSIAAVNPETKHPFTPTEMRHEQLWITGHFDFGDSGDPVFGWSAKKKKILFLGMLQIADKQRRYGQGITIDRLIYYLETGK